MSHRFYVPDLPLAGGPLSLPPEEALHAIKVLRVRPGNRVLLFDGQGQHAEAGVRSVDRREVVLDAAPARYESRMPPAEVTVAVALPKGDRARFLVEKLTELGVATLLPLECRHAQWAPTGKALQKLSRTVIEACKQSGRNQLMHMATPIEAETFLAQPTDPSSQLWFAHPSEAAGVSEATTRGLEATGVAADAAMKVVIAIGPEGGFADREVDAARSANWQVVQLGPRRYRIETAAIALATLAVHRGGNGVA